LSGRIDYLHGVWWLPLLEVAVRYISLCLFASNSPTHFSVFRRVLYWFNPIQVRACHGSYRLASNSATPQSTENSLHYPYRMSTAFFKIFGVEGDCASRSALFYI